MRTEALIGQGDSAVKRIVGQSAWHISSATKLRIRAFSDDGLVARVEWVDDEFVLRSQVLPCVELRIGETLSED